MGRTTTRGALLAAVALLSAPAWAFDEPAAMQASQAAVGREVRDVELVTAAGQHVRLSEFRGKPVVVSLIYTSCAGICPLTTQRLAAAVRVAREAVGADGFTVLSIGFDTAHDTPQALKGFAAAQRVGDAHWLFASADTDAIARLAADTGFWYAPGAGLFEHIVQTTLLDARGRVALQVYGEDFAPPELAEPVRTAALGAPIAASAPSLLRRVRLLCTVYDPRLGRYRTDYSLALSLLIAVSSLVGLLVLVGRAWREAGRRGAA